VGFLAGEATQRTNERTDERSLFANERSGTMTGYQ